MITQEKSGSSDNVEEDKENEKIKIEKKRP